MFPDPSLKQLFFNKKQKQTSHFLLEYSQLVASLVAQR